MASTSDARPPSNATPLDEECAICFGEIILRCTLACKHQFCFDCSKTWLLQAGNCPVCRGEADVNILNEPQQLNLKMGLPKGRKRAHDAQSGEEDDMEDVKPNVEELKAAMAKKKFVSTTNAKIFWLYETKTGGAWWRFSLLNEEPMEEAFKANLGTLDMEILGRMYTINFTEMTQRQKQYPDIVRNIKRVDEEEYDQLKIIGIGGCVQKDDKVNPWNVD
ncbi:hypothetical protein GCK72_025375 [Caenorhabditis remanei]|uniref:E3 ubiquitin-protein ligase n=1 Tax=Caenorhabditis remanei TaxID=31234 RepID=A0A6A5G1U4_CAERE|nr:hypothetical protein GCK72_025375 [Caenorhabditis remanei]KAF1748908.1 hypothetical protein GCK72_025375 [Caenorhabditis remanei]